MIVENGLRYGQMTKDELEAVNATGGINGKKVEVILLDDECKPDKGIANVNRFINQNKVHLVIGSTCSSVSLPMVDITAKEEVPQIIPHSTNTGITKKGSAWVFRTSVSERFSASIHGKWLSENVGKKVAYLYTNDGAGIGFAKDYMAFMKKNYNIEPAYEAQMQETDLDFRAHLLKIKSLGVEVLAIGGQLDAIARIAQQSYEVGIPKKVRRISASAASNAPVPELAGDAAVGLTFAAALASFISSIRRTSKASPNSAMWRGSSSTSRAAPNGSFITRRSTWAFSTRSSSVPRCRVVRISTRA